MSKELEAIERGYEEIELPQPMIALTRELVKVSKGVEDLAAKAVAASEEGKRQTGEDVQKLTRAVEDLHQKINAQQRIVVFPEMDPFLLREDRSSAGFARLMRSKPDSYPKIGALVRELQEASAVAALVQLFACDQMNRKHDYKWKKDELLEMEHRSNSRPFSRFYNLRDRFADAIGVEKRALDSQTAGEGLEWIPTLMGTDLLEKMLVQLRAAALLQTINMPSNPWLWPFKTAFPRAQRTTESTGTPATPGATSGVTTAYASAKPTAQKQFTAKKIRIVEFFSWEFDVDSIVAAASVLVADFATGLAIAREAGMFNGDTNSSAHIDADITPQTAGTSVETVVDGLRDNYLNKSTVPAVDVSGTPVTEHYLNAIGLLTKEFAADLGNQYWFASVLGHIQMMANKDMRKLSDLGPQAVILAGQVGEMLNRPVIISGQLRDDLSAGGVNVSGGANNLTAILLGHVGRWKWGVRPAAPLESQRLPIEDQQMLVVHDRFDLQFVGESTDTSVSAIHGIPTTVTVP